MDLLLLLRRQERPTYPHIRASAPLVAGLTPCLRRGRHFLPRGAKAPLRGIAVDVKAHGTRGQDRTGPTDGDGRRRHRHARLLHDHHGPHDGDVDGPALRGAGRRGRRRRDGGAGGAGNRVQPRARRQRRHGAAGQGLQAAHGARRPGPAPRRHRLRDLRRGLDARHDELRPEHQSPPRRRGRAVAHHLLARPSLERPRPPRDAGARTLQPREPGAVGVDRPQGPRHARRPARSAPSSTSPPPP